MMKSLLSLTLLLSVNSVFATDEPVAPCSLAVGIVPRTGLIYRTWTNALETIVFESKGLNVCQDDADDRVLRCKTEFKLTLLYYPDQLTRVVTIYRGGERVFTQDFDGNLPSQKLLKTIPTCAELTELSVLE